MKIELSLSKAQFESQCREERKGCLSTIREGDDIAFKKTKKGQVPICHSCFQYLLNKGIGQQVSSFAGSQSATVPADENTSAGSSPAEVLNFDAQLVARRLGDLTRQVELLNGNLIHFVNCFMTHADIQFDSEKKRFYRLPDGYYLRVGEQQYPDEHGLSDDYEEHENG